MKYITHIAFALLAAFSFLSSAQAADPIQSSYFGNKAISGYDPVAYLTEGKAVKGSKKHKLEWKGANWFFASAENRNKFQQNPDDYAPQYGGYCAWAVAENKLVKVNPKVFEIRDGKVYLFYNDKIRNTWVQDASNFIKRADQNFDALIAN